MSERASSERTFSGVIPRTHVLVDLDGTITDSFPAITGSLQAGARASSTCPMPPTTALRHVVGPPFELGLPLVGVPGDQLWAVIDRYRVHYEAGGLFECGLYDGVTEMLDDLVAAGHDAVAWPRPSRRRRPCASSSTSG